MDRVESRTPTVGFQQNEARNEKNGQSAMTVNLLRKTATEHLIHKEF